MPTHPNKSYLVAAIAVVTVLTFPSALRAGPITLQNASFEDGGALSAGTTDPTGWTVTSVGPTDAGYVRTSPSPYYLPADGINVYRLDDYNYDETTDPVVSTTLSQTTTHTAQVGETFTLTVAGVAEAEAAGASNDVILTINGHAVADNSTVFSYQTVEQPDGSYIPYMVDHTITYTLTAADVLADPSLNLGVVGVEIVGTNGQTEIDDVRLSSTPEPSTWALLIGGCASLIGFRQIRRKV